jgi:flagellar hook assembly protein FlgD
LRRYFSIPAATFCEKEDAMKLRVYVLCLVTFLFGSQSMRVAGFQGDLITSVKLNQQRFSPAGGERLPIHFSLDRNARVTLKVFDPDNHLVAVLLEGKQCSRGINTIFWNGRNSEGDIVPDTAYYFTIDAIDEAKVAERYDPAAISGGEVTKVRLIGTDDGVAYALPNDAMVRIRIGIHNGPLMKTLLDWAPREAGDHFEPWNGLDDSGIIDVRSTDYSLNIQAYALPENSMITEGSGLELSEAIIGGSGRLPENLQKTPLDRQQREKLLVKKKAGREASTADIHSHYSMTQAIDRAPRFSIRINTPARKSLESTRPASPSSAPLDAGGKKTASAPDVVSGIVEMTIDLEELSGIILANQRYEVIVYIDNEFHMEDEQGYHPYTFQLDTNRIANGSHTITFNVATLTDQVGSGSIQIYVQN